MISSKDFKPDWISPPGDTIVELLDEFGLSVEELSKKIGLSPKKGQQLIDGKLTICESIASRLESTLRVSSGFWLTRDSQYQNFKLQLQEQEKAWLDLLPISDMVKYGWIPKRAPRTERVKHCLRFFNEDSITNWFINFHSNSFSVAYRSSNILKNEPTSVYTWLAFARNISLRTNCLPWDKELLKDVVPEIRKLTNESSPKIFVPELKRLLSEVGVVFVIARTPSGCRASGATCFFEKNKATLVMSFRYLTDDHFWFTLFHEIGHLILHSDNREFHIEDNGISGMPQIKEDEANKFAVDTLIPEKYQSEMKKIYKNDWKKIVRLSKKIGVSKGILLGQLQHLGNIDYAYLNRFKVRYKWENN
ncbi:transcriptional regulator [Xenorhabdus vietnamensis]|uniref:Transcriptional regulator n=1 Tax=Xenorhabdus vietnamensis TaxID=351656 RepID=A0A1Y2SI22_9GAMM|nr:ImmA/IrrE family metallo-endopeptidase [Xenorhabdus vietnamensis]OTA17658.1 transcriptional regulator [Xenorhabdus vietnamensis]